MFGSFQVPQGDISAMHGTVGQMHLQQKILCPQMSYRSSRTLQNSSKCNANSLKFGRKVHKCGVKVLASLQVSSNQLC